jgi:serine/threonine protein kinase/Tfp pilus assembly protein PilF
MKAEALPSDLALDIAIQIASALSAAHAAGIIHRDIKPENVMLRADGLVKVLDFGIAKFTQTEGDEKKDLVETMPGRIIGTAAYMSPEQARGALIDRRSDIWSLGVMLYEMVASRLPFWGNTAADVIAAVLERQPAALPTHGSVALEALERIIFKALQKERDNRYQTAAELMTDLKQLRQTLEHAGEQERSGSPKSSVSQEGIIGPPLEPKTVRALPVRTAGEGATPSSAEYIADRIKHYKYLMLVVLVTLITAAGFLAYRSLSSNKSQPIESIAVMPFVNESGNADVEYLSDGMTESLINSLSQLPSLLVKARSSVFSYKGRDTKPQQVAAELSVQAILNGRFVLRGNDVTLYLSLVDARNGNQLWGEQYNRKLTDLVALQGEIARDVSRKLRVRLSRTDEQKLTKNYTGNAEAYQLYLKGRFFWSKRTPQDFQKSRDYFQQAIDLDPTYALAYSGLADFYGVSATTGLLPPNETWPKNEALVRKALELDPNLAEAHNSLAALRRHYYRDWAGAEQELKRAIELDHNYAEAHAQYGGYLTHMGRFDEALIERKRGIELDPLASSINVRLGDTLYFMRRYVEAIEQYRKTLELDPNSPLVHERLGNAYEQQGMSEQAIGEWSAAFALAKNDDLATMLERTFRESGFSGAVRAVARKKLEQLNEKARRGEYVPAMYFARLCVRLGDRDQAFVWLGKAAEERNALTLEIKLDPAFDSLRSDPRFPDVLRRVGY